MPRRDPSRRLLSFARRMRQQPTDAERKLWSLLRDHRLAGFHFRRQVPVAGYILDFLCAKSRLAVEADGGQHFDEEHLAYDERRATALRAQGIRVVRFTDVEILKEPDYVRDAIYQDLTEPPEPPP